MSDPFIGEVQIFGFNFPPRNWASCNGATLALRQNATLFSLIGTTYGGNGTTTFQLPNLANRVAISQGDGPGLSPRSLGEPIGENGVSIGLNEMPLHVHALTGYTGGTGNVAVPATGAGFGSGGRISLYAAGGTTPDTSLADEAILPFGDSQPHENRQPFLALNYCIALAGVFPSFS